VRDADRAAFEAFFLSQYPRVVRSLYLATGHHDGANDAAQEAFSRLFARWIRVSNYERPDAWVLTVAFRLARRAHARRRTEVPFENVPEHVAVPVAHDPDLWRAIGSLPRAQRTAIVLHYYEGLSVEEVAGTMGCASSTAKVHLHRARKRLAAVLDTEVDDVTR
jgi:RNA polymerase sigma factor (sigma-70 family)